MQHFMSLPLDHMHVLLVTATDAEVLVLVLSSTLPFTLIPCRVRVCPVDI